jgi:uncharacterized protein (TIGR02466 family)
MEIESHWATPIFISNLEKMDDFNNNIKKTVIELIKDNSVFKSNRGGWQSSLQNPEGDSLFYLTNKIKEKCSKIFKIEIKKINVTQIWINVNNKHNWNVIHQHGGENHLSGTYYVKSPNNSGDIVFRDPRPAAISNQFFRKFIDKGELRKYKPEDSLLILFPSFLDHFVEPNEVEDSRISISFDVKFII